jgi:signal transduction histidine kinase
LAIVSKIVQDHSGTVTVEQTSEAGTTVLVRLPCSERPISRNVKSTFI